MSKKRRRETIAVDTQLVEIYEDLANSNEKIRLKAAETLLAKVSPEGDLDDQQLNEVLRRLIRGLCSNRKVARLGFSIALTEFLIQLFGPNTKYVSPFISISDFITMLERYTYIGGNVSGQEERDHHFGRLFGAECVVKSGVLFNVGVGVDLWSQMVNLLTDLAKRKPWLREECGWVLYQAIHMLGKSNCDPVFAQLIINSISDNGLAMAPEGIAIWIAAMTKTPMVKFPKGLWKRGNPLHRKETARLGMVMKEASTLILNESKTDSKGSQKGHWTSKPHFAWEVIIDRILSHQLLDGKTSTTPSKEIELFDFWEECVDKNLFAASSSEERKFWGFLLFQRILRDAPTIFIRIPFSKNLMRCLTNQLASSDRYLHRIARQSMKILLQRAESEAQAAASILDCLLSPPNGHINFDQVTKSKTIEKLIALVDISALSDVSQVLGRLASKPGTLDHRAAASRRQLIGDLFVNLVRSKQPKDFAGDSISSCISPGAHQLLSLLVRFAYFTQDDASESTQNADEPPMSQVTHDMFKTRLSSCLTYLTAKSANPAPFAFHVVSIIHTQERRKDFLRPLIEMEDAVGEVIGKAWKTLENICATQQTLSQEENPLLTVFQLLFSLAILQVYNGDPDAVNILDELQDGYNKLTDRMTAGCGKSSEILVEVILSFISKPSLLFRRLGQRAFSACTSDLDKIGLQSMFKALTATENLTAYDAMFERNDEDDGSDNDRLDIEEQSAVMKLTTINDHESLGNNTNSEDDSSSGITDNENGSDGVDEELAAFDAKLAQALGTRLGNDDEAAHDADFSDEAMNDEQMEALDVHLEKVFRERKRARSKKSQTKEAKQTMISFKCRILELLDVFVKQQHANPLTLDLLLPLLTTIRVTKSPLVSSKACTLIRDYSRLCKGPGTPLAAPTDSLFYLLETTHAEAAREGSNAYATACSLVSLLLVKILAAQDRNHLRRVVALYSTTQERTLFEPQCRVKFSFFTDWLNWCSSARSH